MKIEVQVGDKVRVTKGKLAGKEDTVIFIDKKNARVRLSTLKKGKTKGKGAKEIHGTFGVASLLIIKKPEAPAAAEKPAS